MIDLTEHIEYLLRHHDSLAVPGLGLFLAEYHSAYIAPGGSEFCPPRRSVTLNPNVDFNDGLLVTSLMRRHHLSRATASETLSACITALLAKVKTCGETAIGRLGALRHSDQGLQFIPSLDSSANIFASLPEISVVPVLKAAKAESEAGATAEELAPIFLPSRQSRGYWGRIAAMLAIIAAFGIALMSGDNSRGDRKPSLAAFGSYKTAEKAIPLNCELYIAMPAPEEGTANVSTESWAANVKGSISPTSVKEAEKLEAKQTPSAESTGHESVSTTKSAETAAASPAGNSGFCLVVASFGTRAKAEEWIASQKANADFRVYETPNRARVYIAKADSKEDLIDRQRRASTEFQGAWICPM